MATKTKEKPVKHLTPCEMRKFLHKSYKQHPKWIIEASDNISELARDNNSNVGRITPSMLALEILEFCLSDVHYPFDSQTEDELTSPNDVASIEKIIELKGLALVPLADGNISRFAISKNPFILATNIQQYLLSPKLKSIFISSEATIRLGGLGLDRYFDNELIKKTLNLRQFDVHFLAKNINKVLPNVWRNKSVVDWDMTETSNQQIITPLWLYHFWKEVQFNNLIMVEKFAEWPLIPCKNNKLISCSSQSMVLYLSKILAKNNGLEESIINALKQQDDQQIEYKNRNTEAIKAAIDACYSEWQNMNDTVIANQHNEEFNDDHNKPRNKSEDNMSSSSQVDDDKLKQNIFKEDIDEQKNQLLSQGEDLKNIHLEMLHRKENNKIQQNSEIVDSSSSLTFQDALELDVLEEENQENILKEDIINSDDDDEFLTPTDNKEYSFVHDDETKDDDANQELYLLNEILEKLNIPMLEISFFIISKYSNKNHEVYIPNEISINRRVSSIIQSISTMNLKLQNEIQWNRLSSIDRLNLLKLFGSANRLNEPLVNHERVAIKAMPLFECEENNNIYTILNDTNIYCSIAPKYIDFHQMPYLKPNIKKLNDNKQQKHIYLLKDYSNMYEIKELYNDLGVLDITECGLYVYFLLPCYYCFETTQQQQIMDRIVSQWDILKTQHVFDTTTNIPPPSDIPSILNNNNNNNNNNNDLEENLQDESDEIVHNETPQSIIMKTIAMIPFISVSGILIKANSLFDPENVLLAAVYEDEPHRFPNGIWLNRLSFLRDVGMRRKINRLLFLLCAKKLATIGEEFETCDFDIYHDVPLRSRSTNNTSQYTLISTNEKPTTKMTFEKAHLVSKSLIEYLWSNFTKFYTPQFAYEIAKISFVPIMFPITDNMKYISSKKRMVKYDQCALPRDYHLVWTQLPVLTNDILPPEATFSNLGIIRPPKLQYVINHLKIITYDSNILFLSREKNINIIKVFSNIYKYLDENWSSISYDIKDSLKRMNIIPIVNNNNDIRLVKPLRVFFRMSHNLSPFMFEMPRQFGVYESLFTSLGSKEHPSIYDYLNFLSDLRKEVKYNPLNPNELRAVLKVIKLISELKQLNKDDSSFTNLYIPNNHAILTNSNQCILRDVAWLANRIDLSRCKATIPLYYTHPLISLNTCKELNIKILSNIIYDELQTSFHIERLFPNNNNNHNKNISQFHDKICESTENIFTNTLSNQQFLEAITHLIIQQENQYHIVNYNSLFNHIKKVFINYKIYFVKTLQSKYILEINSQKFDVTNLGMLESTCYYINEKNRIIYIAQMNQSVVKPSYILAMAINQLLSLYHSISYEVKPLQNLLPLVTLFSVTSSSSTIPLSSIMSDLRVPVDDGYYIENQLVRGIPGSYLLEYDRNTIQLKPLRHFIQGEVVAIHEEKTNKLIYATVLDNDDNTITTTTTLNHNNNNNHDIASQTAIKKVKLLININPDVERFVLSTKIYSFKSTDNMQMNESTESESESDLASLYDFPLPVSSNMMNNDHNNIIETSTTEQSQEQQSQAQQHQQYVSNEELLSELGDIMLQLGLTTSNDAKDELKQEQLLVCILSLHFFL